MKENKLITFVVPCYNSQDYMEKCVDSLLKGGEKAEILIIDDGSTDRTGEIADRYERDHPGRVRALHQENGGHGEGINHGLRALSLLKKRAALICASAIMYMTIRERNTETRQYVTEIFFRRERSSDGSRQRHFAHGSC